MGKVNFFILRNGIIERRHNTIYFTFKDEKDNLRKRILPVEKIYSIYAYGRITIKSGALSYLMKLGIPVHFFNKYGHYEGNMWPRESLISGELLVKQVEHYLDKAKRLELAKEFVRGSLDNILINLKYYERKYSGIEENIEKIKEILNEIEKANNIPELMSCEGRAREIYYHAWNRFIPEKFRFEKRSRRPPENMINALISFGNQLVYSVCLTEIYNTQLNPTISYLHEPFERRFSLALDIAEIFKPLLADRTIFRLIKQEKIDESYFRKELNSCILNEKGKRKFLEMFEKRLKTTIRHRALGRKVSYQRLIRLECYKLIKHLIGMKRFKAFRIWW